MDAKNKLLDKARGACSLASDGALAVRLDVSRQLLSGWRKGHHPMPDDRIAQLAKLAHEDPAPWLAAIRAEQTEGSTARAWAAAAKRLGWAATLAGAAILSTAPTPSYAARAALGASSYNSVSYVPRRRPRRLRKVRIAAVA